MAAGPRLPIDRLARRPPQGVDALERAPVRRVLRVERLDGDPDPGERLVDDRSLVGLGREQPEVRLVLAHLGLLLEQLLHRPGAEAPGEVLDEVRLRERLGVGRLQHEQQLQRVQVVRDRCPLCLRLGVVLEGRPDTAVERRPRGQAHHRPDPPAGVEEVVGLSRHGLEGVAAAGVLDRGVLVDETQGGLSHVALGPIPDRLAALLGRPAARAHGVGDSPGLLQHALVGELVRNALP